MEAPEGTPLDTSSAEWQRRKKQRTQIHALAKEKSDIKKGYLKPCVTCLRAANMLINGHWFCGPCFQCLMK